jgi:hypothetical protein
MRFTSMCYIVPMVIGLCLGSFASPASADMKFSGIGVSNVLDDQDPADGFAYNTILGFDIVFTVPDNPVFVGNSQVEGGSSTDYSGAVIESLSLYLVSGPNMPVVANVPGNLNFWDRADFGAGQDNVDIESAASALLPSVGISWDAMNDPSDLAYDGMFVRGTPGANTMLPGFLPTFSAGSPRDSLYGGVWVIIESDGSAFPEGRFRGEFRRIELIPEPATLILMTLGLPLLLKRKRLGL